MTTAAVSPWSSLRVAGFPARYIQGQGALEALGAVARDLGVSRVLRVCDDVVEAAIGERAHRRLVAEGLQSARLRFAGECTRGAIGELAASASAPGSAAVLGLGGGKAIDTAKGVARALGLPLVIAPTIASNDSATSRLIVLYDEQHRLLGVELLARNPDVVLVDTREIARAPVRFFRAGIGDALSKRFEASQCDAARGLNFHGGRPPALALQLAESCYQVIEARGEAATRAVETGACDDDVEAVTEATVLLSGLGFESGGLSFAHALVRGLSTIPATAAALHGEAVAFGTVVQLLLERRAGAAIDAHLALLRRVGLQVSLKGLGKAVLSEPELDSLLEATLLAPYVANFPRRIDRAELRQAVLSADALLGTAAPPAAS